MGRYSYAAEKLAMGRQYLMLPHSRGEERAISLAFHECLLGLHDLKGKGLDEEGQKWLGELRQLMSTDGVTDSSGRGLWVAKAEQLSVDERITLSRTSDGLACWSCARARSE